ncbi:unnamed protein product [Heligmosomoides polygyrus]|uniref:Integrase catalytic domain-containing protein n=1 Tax=Heligmosomoides polygyrus TaxID=6339 RepID=A0A183GRG8_HELPZ|nr:unnamed protein product [Heligmosomoides polygyrus]
MKIVVAAERRMYHLFSTYSPQRIRSDQAKDEFWSLLDEMTAGIPSKISSDSLATLMGTSTRRKTGTAVMVDSVTGRETQMDRDRNLVTDAKVVPYEMIAPQHRPLICTLKISTPRLKQVERYGAAKIK